MIMMLVCDEVGFSIFIQAFAQCAMGVKLTPHLVVVQCLFVAFKLFLISFNMYGKCNDQAEH